MQVCLSRELRQRVLLIQILKRPTILTPHAPRSNPPLSQLPLTQAFVASIQGALARAHLCMSALYLASVGRVCKCPGPPLARGLDAHFVGQFVSLCKESMWAGLRDASQALEDHLEGAERECAELMLLLQPIYKQHGLLLPLPPQRPAIDQVPLMLPSWDDTEDIEEDAENEKDGGDGKADKVLSLTSLKANASLSSGSKLPKADPPDGMSLCLLAQSACVHSLQKRCDGEFAARLQQKNEHIVRVMDGVGEYQRYLLEYLVLADPVPHPEDSNAGAAAAVSASVAAAGIAGGGAHSAAAADADSARAWSSNSTVGVQEIAAVAVNVWSRLQQSFVREFSGVPSSLPPRPEDLVGGGRGGRGGSDSSDGGGSGSGNGSWSESGRESGSGSGSSDGSGDGTQSQEPDVDEEEDGPRLSLLALATSSDELQEGRSRGGSRDGRSSLEGKNEDGLGGLEVGLEGEGGDGSDSSTSSASTDYGEG